MRYPERLKMGDVIGICAPSSGVPERLFSRLDKAIENVRALGYRCVETPSVRKNDKCVSADARTRARELMSLYEDPEIRVIMPPWGGEFLMDMLPHLDFERLRALPLKWICGYSDVTTLLFALTLRCDMATVHGSNFMNLGFKEIAPTDLTAFKAMSGDEIIQRGSKFWGRFTSWDDTAAPAYTLDRESAWQTLEGEKQSSFSGRMIGGCMDVLCKLLGTEYAPVGQFLARYQDDGFIWTLESAEMNAADIYRTLWQMRQCGWFSHCRGLLIGRPDGYSDQHGFTLTDALEQSFEGLGIPVIYGADIGHIPPQIQIVNGAFGRVEYKDGAAVVHQTYRS